jgi:tetratricopeptide (TPR) repeat protein
LLALGTALAHYRILSRLGSGGMGEVYLAQDTRLGRKVALKILSPDLTRRADRLLRFEQEARAASALNHPNIVTIHDIGQDGDTRYLVTEYVEGETLRTRLARGPLPLRDALDCAVQVAGALAAAHAAGIVHRDVKPENLMLRPDGLVKVLDFGLAKLTEPAHTPSATEATATVAAFDTEPGQVAGTPFYMSPEQARGLKVDARTDVFSLGVVLYEMLAGRRPFEGETTSHAMVAILEKDPLPLTRYLPGAPPELQRILSKALEKNRDERYQGVKDVQLDLKRLVGQALPPVNAAKRRIPLKPILATLALLVLAAAALFFYLHRTPALTAQDTILIAEFVNTTGDPVFDTTLRQGLAAELEQSPFLNLLAEERVRESLRLMSRPPDTRITSEIGREICLRQGAKALIEGSIAALGAHYVLTLAAVKAATGEDIARLQVEAESKERVVRALGDVASRLRRKLGEALPSVQAYDVPLDQATTSSLEALKAFSIGRERTNAGDFAEAIRYQKRAIELDPNFASAYRGLATNYTNLGQTDLSHEATRKAYELRERSSERERLMIEALYTQDVAVSVDRQIEILSQVTKTWPRYYPAWNQIGLAYRLAGQHEKALEAFQALVRLSPSAVGFSNLALSFLDLNRFAEAKEVCSQATQRGTDTTTCHRTLYYVALMTGDTAATQQQLDWAAARPDQYDFLTWQANVAAFRGQLRRERELRLRSVEYHLGRNARERAANSIGILAVDEAFFGQCRQAQQDAPKEREIRPTALVANTLHVTARCGDPARADSLASEAVKASPENNRVNGAWIPCLRALAAARAHRPVDLSAVRGPNPLGAIAGLDLDYCRGEVLLSQNQPADAAAQFQHILDHRGWSPVGVGYPAAHLGLARAAVQANDLPKARKFYQDFFALMKDADQDLPLLLDARREYEKLR